MKAGIVTANKNGEVFEREGSLKLPQEELIGGWCEVSVRGMKFPIKSVVSLEEYSKSQATWKQMPCVMIRKCAIVTALREAFPEDLQGLYDSAEIKTVPDKLPQKPIEIGKASPSQKQGILKLASMKGLYDYENKKIHQS
ncbi:recombinase RecT [Clostridioides difficile]|nr:recombinase RecT [Clostridioides difficile]